MHSRTGMGKMHLTPHRVKKLPCTATPGVENGFSGSGSGGGLQTTAMGSLTGMGERPSTGAQIEQLLGAASP